MLPTVAAVLPAEKLNETLVKWALLPCCRFSGPACQSCVCGQFFSKSPKNDAQKLICALFMHPFFCCQRLYYWHRPKQPMQLR